MQVATGSLSDPWYINPLRLRVAIRFVTVLMLVLALGWHWALLQTVAWTAMLANYSRQASLSQAVSDTFDGKHPCPLCKAISKGKQDEKKTEFSKPGKSFDFSYESTFFVFTAPAVFWLSGETPESVRSADLSPPAPPPRLVPA
jgi:hypothetical protein